MAYVKVCVVEKEEVGGGWVEAYDFAAGRLLYVVSQLTTIFFILLLHRHFSFACVGKVLTAPKAIVVSQRAEQTCIIIKMCTII